MDKNSERIFAVCCFLLKLPSLHSQYFFPFSFSSEQSLAGTKTQLKLSCKIGFVWWIRTRAPSLLSFNYSTIVQQSFIIVLSWLSKKQSLSRNSRRGYGSEVQCSFSCRGSDVHSLPSPGRGPQVVGKTLSNLGATISHDRHCKLDGPTIHLHALTCPPVSMQGVRLSEKVKRILSPNQADFI